MKYKLISILKKTTSLTSISSYHFNNNNNINVYNSFLLNNNDIDYDVKSALFPFQVSVVILIFSIFGILRYKISKSSTIKENILIIKNDIKNMKLMLLSNNDGSINSSDINEKEFYLKKLIEEFNEAKTVLKINNYNFNIPIAAIGGDINNNDNDNNSNDINNEIRGSSIVVSSFTQLIRLVFGIIVLYGLCFILYLLNSPNLYEGL